jgi:hypothetical protein
MLFERIARMGSVLALAIFAAAKEQEDRLQESLSALVATFKIAGRRKPPAEADQCP